MVNQIPFLFYAGVCAINLPFSLALIPCETRQLSVRLSVNRSDCPIRLSCSIAYSELVYLVVNDCPLVRPPYIPIIITSCWTIFPIKLSFSLSLPFPHSYPTALSYLIPEPHSLAQYQLNIAFSRGDGARIPILVASRGEPRTFGSGGSAEGVTLEIALWSRSNIYLTL